MNRELKLSTLQLLQKELDPTVPFDTIPPGGIQNALLLLGIFEGQVRMNERHKVNIIVNKIKETCYKEDIEAEDVIEGVINLLKKLPGHDRRF